MLTNPCATSASKCCKMGPYFITTDDYERLLPEERAQVTFASGPIVSGALPMLPDGTCGFLRKWGCSIHDRKPGTCADADPYACNMWEPDPDKISGRIVLGVRPL